MRANTQNVQQGEQETRGVGEGRTKQWGNRHEICGRERDGAGNTGYGKLEGIARNLRGHQHRRWESWLLEPVV